MKPLTPAAVRPRRRVEHECRLGNCRYRENWTGRLTRYLGRTAREARWMDRPRGRDGVRLDGSKDGPSVE